MSRMFRRWSSLAAVVAGLVLSTGCKMARVEAPAQPFSIAVMADPRGKGDTWRNALLEVRDRKANPAPPFAPAELMVIAGDMDPLAARHADFLGVFTNAAARPVFLPVIGNHEFENGGVHFLHARDVLIPAIPGLVRRHATSCDYYLDHRNVRIIALDAYTDLGKGGVINDEGRAWAAQVIGSTPASIDHIFVSFHEPAFPRVRHVGDSFDKDPGLRDAFWRMLLEHKDRVRAVLVGHTHSYYRMRVLDPSGAAASNPAAFPDEAGGIHQIDAGAAGNGSVNTLVQIQIAGRDVHFRVLQAPNGADRPFAEVDQWSIVHRP